MIYEVGAAVDHIVSLIKNGEQKQLATSEAISSFSFSIKDQLEKRCQTCWFPHDHERGSASRAVHWQLHPAGEGADEAILEACRTVLQGQAEEGEIVEPTSNQVVSLALSWLPKHFSLWIDPGCVAIRMGPGPGISRSFFEIDTKPLERSTPVSVIWGEMLAQHSSAENNRPTVTITTTPVTRVERRPIPIVNPESRFPSDMVNGRPSHRRTVSGSSFGSTVERLSRSVSMTSNKSNSTDATSYYSGSEDSDACPSLVSPSGSSTSSRCTSDMDDEPKAQAFTGVNLFFHDETEEAGDVTIRAGDFSSNLLLEKGAVITPRRKELQQETIEIVAQKPQSNLQPSQGLELSTPVVANPNDEPAAPIKCNYTTHDNGNVGVLGGGVRLGSIKCNSNSNISSNVNNISNTAPRHRQHINSKSVSQANTFYPMSLREMQKNDQVYYAGAGHYSAPMLTVPLPPQHQYAPQHPQYSGAIYGGPSPSVVTSGCSSPVYATFPALPPPHGFYAQANYCQTGGVTFAIDDVDSQQLHSNNGSIDGGRRRVRSRGRRSRGRGAGRAARRQAAALKALNEADIDEESGSAGALGLDLDGASITSRASSPCPPSDDVHSYFDDDAAFDLDLDQLPCQFDRIESASLPPTTTCCYPSSFASIASQKLPSFLQSWSITV